MSKRLRPAGRKGPDDLPGAQNLEVYLAGLLAQNAFSQLVIGIEATCFYDFHILEFLAQSDLLVPYRPTFYRLNPKLISGFKKIHTSRSKNDRQDALLIASRLCFGELPAPYQPHQAHLPLQRLTRFRAHTVQSLTAEQNHFLGVLFLKFSAYTQVKPFSNPFGATGSALIEEFFSLDELLQMPLEQLTQFILQKGKKRFPDPEAMLWQVARESYRLGSALNQSVNLVLNLSYRTIQTLKETIKRLDGAIAQQFQGFSSTLTSIPGIGPVYAAGILAEIGDIQRFAGQAQLPNYAGLVWSTHQSGAFQAQETRLSKAANSVKNHEPEFRAFYTKKYREVFKHQHKRALVLTARKLVRLIFALQKEQRLYQPKEHYISRKEQTR